MNIYEGKQRITKLVGRTHISTTSNMHGIKGPHLRLVSLFALISIIALSSVLIVNTLVKRLDEPNGGE